MTDHRELLDWVQEMAAMCRPDRIVWVDGSDEEKERLTAEAIAAGEVIELNQTLHPGCIYHRTNPNDVARTEHLTFICTTRQEDAGPTNNWKSPEEAYREARGFFTGCMVGRTMFVVPFSMGPVGSPFAKYGVELTDSIYVVLNMRIMCHIGATVLKQLGTSGAFTKCLHSKCALDESMRRILHFPEDNTIWSCNSGYGGNVLLGKKCLSLRIGSYLGRREGWMAEHMLIMGIEDPAGRIEYIAAAFPSACGKTNLAMLVPPEGLKAKGYRIWTVGDDIAWMRIDTDGRLWAINPEAGFFGVAPGTNSKSNPSMMETVKKNTIFTNTVLCGDGSTWWEGLEKEQEVVQPAFDWKGRPWEPGAREENGAVIKGAHPNSRFTAPIDQCPSASKRREHHHGVPISAIIFGGRREHLAPLIYQSFDWEHGVFVGATMASEVTAAAQGLAQEVRRDPMAMLPFCGYQMGDYFDHWLDMGRRMTDPPRIFHVNWFRKDGGGEFLWPGFGDNLRVLEWVLARCRGEADAVETPIGYVPTPDSLDLASLKITSADMKKLLDVRPGDWLEELNGISAFFHRFDRRLPKEMWEQYTHLRTRLMMGVSVRTHEGETRTPAGELNAIITEQNTNVYAMLSALGRRLFFPKGILAQSAEAKAKAKRYDATIGIATRAGQPLALPSVMKHLPTLSPGDAVSYAPATGRADLRVLWREHLLSANPSLAGRTDTLVRPATEGTDKNVCPTTAKSFSLPIVTAGVTHALSLTADLFVDPGDLVLLPDKYWENYDLLFGMRHQAQTAHFGFFSDEGRFNVEGLRQALEGRMTAEKTVLIFNFPNNPTGYCLTKADADATVAVLVATAERGQNLVVICDDAYFGLAYEADALAESLFARLAGAHSRILAVKVDGPTKEEYVWGFRTGMLTFSAQAAGSDDALYGALEKKVAGGIRSAVSNCSMPAQSILVRALADPAFAAEQADARALLAAREAAVHAALDNPAYADLWEPYPFNAGYFMCLRLKEVKAEKLRVHLLDKYGVGVIADDKHDIRIAFSSVEEEKIAELFDLIASGVRDLMEK